MTLIIDDRLHRRIVEATQEAVILADRDGFIRLWNGGAERLFGWTSAEAASLSFSWVLRHRVTG